MVRLADNSYGKSDVRLTKVVRAGETHTLHELVVQIMLGGSFDRVYTDGRQLILHPHGYDEEHGLRPGAQARFRFPRGFCRDPRQALSQFDQVSWTEVSIEEEPWARITVDGAPHPHSFTRGGPGTRTCQVRLERAGASRAHGGIKGLEVIKTTRSGFGGFFKDSYTTLQETQDRIFATRIDATWQYASALEPLPEVFETARSALLETFARHHSASVQQTIFAMGEELLSRLPQIVSVSLTMPNQHRLLVNLGPFGLDNPNEIFVATSEPYGLIKGTVARDGKWEG